MIVLDNPVFINVKFKFLADLGIDRVTLRVNYLKLVEYNWFVDFCSFNSSYVQLDSIVGLDCQGVGSTPFGIDGDDLAERNIQPTNYNNLRYQVFHTDRATQSQRTNKTLKPTTNAI